MQCYKANPNENNVLVFNWTSIQNLKASERKVTETILALATNPEFQRDDSDDATREGKQFDVVLANKYLAAKTLHTRFKAAITRPIINRYVKNGD